MLSLQLLFGTLSGCAQRVTQAARVGHVEMESGREHMPFGRSDVGGEPLPKGDASEVDETGLKG
jgi:hypothetical protein